MINIDELKPLIIERLKPLDPEKIILFGSYAYGNPTEDSDIDLLLIKNVEPNKARDLKVKAKLSLNDLIAKYKISFDIIVASEDFVRSRDDYFYKVDLLQNGKVIYE